MCNNEVLRLKRHQRNRAAIFNFGQPVVTQLNHVISDWMMQSCICGHLCINSHENMTGN